MKSDLLQQFAVSIQPDFYHRCFDVPRIPWGKEHVVLQCPFDQDRSSSACYCRFCERSMFISLFLFACLAGWRHRNSEFPFRIPAYPLETSSISSSIYSAFLFPISCLPLPFVVAWYRKACLFKSFYFFSAPSRRAPLSVYLFQSPITLNFLVFPFRCFQQFSILLLKFPVRLRYWTCVAKCWEYRSGKESSLFDLSSFSPDIGICLLPISPCFDVVDARGGVAKRAPPCRFMSSC